MLRDAAPGDFDAILRLNEESVRFLSPLVADRLAYLHREAAYHRVFVDGDRAVAFLLALHEGSAYDSPNYRWFAARYDRFLYVDRIVVANSHHRRGIGDRLYADLFDFARRSGAPCVTCEIDIEPPNDVSRRFHERHGFEEVGTQSVAGGTKRVSLQVATLLQEDAAAEGR
jgi:uncharacterized protein